MITYPNINPIALHLGPIKIYWYGIIYIIAIIVGWLLAIYRSNRNAKLYPEFIDGIYSSEQISDLIFYVALGIIIGGRVGQIIFYDFAIFLKDPLMLFRIWEGGMSFHGGFLGVIIAFYLFAKKIKKPFFAVADFVAPFVPIGLGLGRVGNFINGELWGRVANVSWAMIFPRADMLPRHPSQLYEFFFEGIVLFFILWFYSAKPRKCGLVSGWFAILYGLFRFGCEFFREPEASQGFLAFGWLTMGELLSLPMILIGIAIIVWSKYIKK